VGDRVRIVRIVDEDGNVGSFEPTMPNVGDTMIVEETWHESEPFSVSLKFEADDSRFNSDRWSFRDEDLEPANG
jgi:hypothetical protein